MNEEMNEEDQRVLEEVAWLDRYCGTAHEWVHTAPNEITQGWDWSHWVCALLLASFEMRDDALDELREGHVAQAAAKVCARNCVRYKLAAAEINHDIAVGRINPDSDRWAS